MDFFSDFWKFYGIDFLVGSLIFWLRAVDLCVVSFKCVGIQSKCENIQLNNSNFVLINLKNIYLITNNSKECHTYN